MNPDEMDESRRLQRAGGPDGGRVVRVMPVRSNRRVQTSRLRFDGLWWWTNLAFIADGAVGLVTGVRILAGTE